MNSHRQRGVALVLTLILLSVITVLALAFLSVTQQERRSVEHSSYATDTDQMVDVALARAQAEIVATILATSNPAAPSLLVSVNLDGNTNKRDYDLPLISTLQYDARAPIFINTNRNLAGALSNDFRYYLDLNRDGFFEDTGWLPVTNNVGSLIFTNDASGVQLAVSNYMVGDPQWLALLADPDLPHASTNYIVGRYAYLVVPIGQTLDLNFIHNDAKYSLDRSISSGYHREQGVGSWEINLAAFLADLNTNVWGPRPGPGDYYYNELSKPADPASLLPNRGYAFDDATDLLLYRYAGGPAQLTNALGLFTNTVNPAFVNDLIDQYGDGLSVVDDPSLPWPGADSPLHFYTLHDLWRTNNGYPAFVGRMRAASETSLATYDQYTPYRLLSQMGTDSAPEPEDALGPKINLNYDNFISSLTNLVEWTPLRQFTAISDRLLRDDMGLTVTNIPVFTNMSSFATNGLPLYSGRVHQMVQLAANIADATRRGPGDATVANAMGEQFEYPDVFKPLFEQRGSDVFIVGYELLDGMQFRADLLSNKYFWHDLNNPSDRPDGTGDARDQYYGVPMIVAARKGHPNFNECAMETVVQVSRKLEFVKRLAADPLPYQTNQMFILGISNVFGVEAWNSYASNYPGDVQMLMVHSMTSVLTNGAGITRVRSMSQNNFNGGLSNVVMADTWRGREIRVPFMRGLMTLTNSVYYQNSLPNFVPVTSNNKFEENVASYTNKWGLTITNHLQFYMFERTTGRLIDAVTLGDLNTYIDISDRLAKEGDTGALDEMWDSRPYGNVSQGVLHQILVSTGYESEPEWVSYDAGGNDDKANAIARFRQFMNLGGQATSDSLTRVMLAPYSPTKRLSQMISWQVNDPLVHYRTEDLRDTTNIVKVAKLTLNQGLQITNSLGQMNTRYRPWGMGFFADSASSSDPNDINPMVKDPGMRSSDYWDFPTNKINLGDLGRVHRGTPWQTIYLKSGRAAPAEWSKQLGAGYSLSGFLTAPTNDWRLFSHFTTAPHPNAELGKLSVNQPGEAAWSAVLSGVPIRRVTPAGVMTNVVIQPFATGDPAVPQIVEGINRERAQHPLGRFERVGDVLATPELTDLSPYLPSDRTMLSDRDYEQIPRRTLSLLTVGSSRFAIYAFGQSLRPAANSIVVAGPYRGLCTNYQVTGESAVRAIVRVEFDPLSLDPSSTNFNKPDWSKPRTVVENYNLAPIE